ncbi:hypothetical protein KW796_01520 [Candidatus Parcubacteria bacterium]|nr:hypothetical protein [Candidatus Parcubacteria bacterium]
MDAETQKIAGALMMQALVLLICWAFISRSARAADSRNFGSAVRWGLGSMLIAILLL